jgi:hypothetical protein
MIPVEGYLGLYRDECSGGIINCNDNEYNEYIRAKQNKLIKEQELKDMKTEIEELKLLLNIVINNKT